MPYFYSARENAFYPDEMRSAYDAAGTWPADAKEVGDDVFTAFALNIAPAGKVRVAGEDGNPAWADAPPVPPEAIASRNNDKRENLMRVAAERIAPLQDAVDLGIATDEERESLSAWKAYRVVLNRLTEQPGYPLDVNWPPLPA